MKYSYFAMLLAHHPVTTVCHTETDSMQHTNPVPHSVHHITFIRTKATKTLQRRHSDAADITRQYGSWKFGQYYTQHCIPLSHRNFLATPYTRCMLKGFKFR